MSTTNEAKAQQLGMPFGTASGKLKKILLFQAIQRLGEDSCYKCSKKIDRIEDFTVEHKKTVAARQSWFILGFR